MDIGAIIKEVEVPPDGLYAYVRARAVIDCPPKVVWDTLADINHWYKWLPMTHRAGILSPEAASKVTPDMVPDKEKIMALDARFPGTAVPKEEKSQWSEMAYEDFDLPWPIKNQWSVKYYFFDDGENMKRAMWRKVNSIDGKDDGFWEITPWKNKRTHLRYYYRVKAKRSVPTPVFSTAVSFTVNSMIKALRRETKRREAKSATVTDAAAATP